MLKSHGFPVMSLIALSVLVGAAYATPISGTLNITGDVSVGATAIDWLPVGGGTGTLTVTASSTGSFAALAGDSGTTKDLDVLAQPVGVPISLPDFIVLPGGISLELTMIDPGVFGSADCGAPPAPGQTCTPLLPPPISPFNLMNTAVGSTASFTVRGVATSGSDKVAMVGTYTTQFTGRDYQNLLATIGGGGTVEASYSANFEAVPEPSTAYLLLGGLALAAGALRRKLFRA